MGAALPSFVATLLESRRFVANRRSMLAFHIATPFAARVSAARGSGRGMIFAVRDLDDRCPMLGCSLEPNMIRPRGVARAIWAIHACECIPGLHGGSLDHQSIVARERCLRKEVFDAHMISPFFARE